MPKLFPELVFHQVKQEKCLSPGQNEFTTAADTLSPSTTVPGTHLAPVPHLVEVWSCWRGPGRQWTASGMCRKVPEEQSLFLWTPRPRLLGGSHAQHENQSGTSQLEGGQTDLLPSFLSPPNLTGPQFCLKSCSSQLC